MDGEREGRRKRARVLAPPDLETAVVEREALVRGHLEERERCGGVDERHKLSHYSYQYDAITWREIETHGNVLVLHVPNALQHAATDGIAQVLRRRLRVDVTQVDGPVQALGAGETSARKTSQAVGECRRVRAKRREAGGVGRERGRVRLNGRKCGLRNEGLSGGGLGSVSCCLLRLGHVGASILAIVDTLASPGGLGRERVHDLKAEEWRSIDAP